MNAFAPLGIADLCRVPDDIDHARIVFAIALRDHAKRAVGFEDDRIDAIDRGMAVIADGCPDLLFGDTLAFEGIV
jgi:hypothetical protein